MQITLQQVVPGYLEEEKVIGSGIWNQSVIFLPGKKAQVVAPSGSGKTSLIHFLYGMRKDYSGNILFNGENIRTFDAERLSQFRQRQISIVFQDLRLFPGQTVMSNLEVKRVLDPFHAVSKIEEMARRLGIHNKLGKMAGTCSYGEQQRIAIIRAMQQPFDLLLLDEPFSNLDDNNRVKVMELMEEEALLRKASILLVDLKPTDFFKADRILNL